MQGIYRSYTITVNWERTYDLGEEVTDPSASPAQAVFDKNPANSQAAAFEVQGNGNQLTAIRNGETRLGETDYSVSGSVYSIGVPYLPQQPLGTLTLAFEFSPGKEAAVNIQIIDTTDSGNGGGTGTDPGIGTDPGTGTDLGTGTDSSTSSGNGSVAVPPVTINSGKGYVYAGSAE